MVDLGGEEFAGVHEAGEDDVVLFGDVAEFAAFAVKDQDGILVEAVFGLTLKDEGVSILNGIKDSLVLDM